MGYKIITITLILFIIILAVGGWQKADLFSYAWWLDELEHAIAGFGGALALPHLLKTHALDGFFRIRGKIFLMFVVVAIVGMIQSHVWAGRIK